MTIKERLNELRSLMKQKHVDAYLVPTDDFHGSEYVGDYFKCRQFITGFTGSAGTAVITDTMAGLWTDGRYFIQAGNQLEGSGVELFKMGEPGVPTIHEFLKENLCQDMCLGFDGRTVSAAEARELKELLSEKNIRFSMEEDLIGQIWTDRPALSCEPAMELETRWTGESRAEKCRRIRLKMEEKHADFFILTSLDDIAWLLNLRGNDIHCCPVVLSYLVMTRKEIFLFAGEAAFSAELIDSLKKDSVFLKPYHEIYDYVKNLSAGKTVLLSMDHANSRLVNSIPDEVSILDEENLTLLPKAVKNPVEVENERTAHIKDGVAVTRFIYWLKKNAGQPGITELSAADYLFGLRKEQENFLGNSFDPIISYGGHAAMCHYSPSPETDVPLEAKGLVLCDTGAHFLEGTTDITRTFALGEITEKERKYFTLVLKGHLNLSDVKFRYGCCGQNLDYLAREPLWRLGEDYNHGTGHGVGYLLNVHEGPNSFRWKSASAVLEEGMITSNEPGYYVENEFGIRHENLIVCKKAEKTAFGQFMCFENLTMVPFDLDALDPALLTDHEKQLLNAYHAEVYRKISPYLNQEESQWLKEATRAI